MARKQEEQTRREPKEPGILGMSLKKSLCSTLSTQAPSSPTGEASPPTSPSPRPYSPRIDEVQSAHKGTKDSQEVTDRIARRYRYEVREVEEKRRQRLRPIDQQDPVKPCERAMARSVMPELAGLWKSCGGHEGKAEIAWDTLVTGEGFQKKMQFLNSHAKTGKFLEKYGDSGFYDGEFLYGMRHGQGTHKFNDEVYEGEWKWDHRHGFGTLALKNGDVVKGDWQAGKPHGYITMTDKDGKVTFEGEFRDGKRDGLGRQVFQSGEIYDGGWQAGRLHDRGVYYFANGDKLYGMWSEGQYDGPGVFHYADGSMSRRTYQKGLLMSVQDYDHHTQRFGKMLARTGMSRHTRDEGFPKEIFILQT